MKLMVPQHSRLLMIWLIFFCLLFLSLGTFFCHFNSLSNNKTLLVCCTSTVSNIIQWKDIENDHASSLSLKPSPNLQLLVNQFNNATPENRNYPEKISSSKYYDTEEIHNIEITQNNKSLSLFHINACSFNGKLMTFKFFWVALKKISYNSNKWNKNHKTSIFIV